MLHTVREHEFFALMQSKERYAEERVADAPHAYRALFQHWSCQYPAPVTVMLGYLISRTLMAGKSAVRVPLSTLGSAVNVGRTSLREHVKRLTDADLIHVYRTEANDEGHEKEPRMFEINFKMLVEPLNLDRETTSKQFKTPGTPLRNPDPPGRNPTPPSYIHSMYSETDKNKDKSLYSARPSRTGSRAGGSVIPMPKKPSAAVMRSDSINEVLASVTARHSAQRNARVATSKGKPAHMLTKLELQAVIDKSMKEFAPTAIRMVVTNKEFGLLRKRLKESAPANFTEFMGWVVRYWATIATQHGNAIKRNESRQERGERAMPKAPDFGTFAYRFPYFLKSFANFQADRTSLEQAEKSDQQVATLQRQLARKDEDLDVLRGQIAKAKSVGRRTRPVAPNTVIAVPLDEDLGEVDIPEWTTQETFGARRNVR